MADGWGRVWVGGGGRAGQRWGAWGRGASLAGCVGEVNVELCCGGNSSPDWTEQAVNTTHTSAGGNTPSLPGTHGQL